MCILPVQNVYMRVACFKVIVFTFTILSLLSCKKNDDRVKYTVNGIVINYPSRLPMPGVKVHLTSNKFSIIANTDTSHWKINHLDTASTYQQVLIDSVISDANGRFTFTYYIDKTDPEYSEISEPYPGSSNTNQHYFGYQSAILSPSLVRVYPGFVHIYNNNSSNIDSIFVDNPSYFRLNMHKITAANSNDTLFEKRSFSFLNSPPGTIWLSYRNAQIGQSNSTILDRYSYNISNNVLVEWRYYRNGLQQTGQQTVNLIPNDTTKLDIYY